MTAESFCCDYFTNLIPQNFYHVPRHHLKFTKDHGIMAGNYKIQIPLNQFFHGY